MKITKETTMVFKLSLLQLQCNTVLDHVNHQHVRVIDEETRGAQHLFHIPHSVCSSYCQLFVRVLPEADLHIYCVWQLVVLLKTSCRPSNSICTPYSTTPAMGLYQLVCATITHRDLVWLARQDWLHTGQTKCPTTTSLLPADFLSNNSQSTTPVAMPTTALIKNSMTTFPRNTNNTG